MAETAIWLIRHGRFREAKQVAMQMYGDRLKMLPDNDVIVPKPRLDCLPGRSPQGPDPLARQPFRLYRVFLPRQRVLDVRFLPSDVFVKVPSFLAIFLFPALFTAIGQAAATLFVAIFPLIGVLAAIFILPRCTASSRTLSRLDPTPH
jgi:hypothetical protein